MTFSEYILDVNEGDFEEAVILRSHELTVVVDFWAPWCGPCRNLSPLLERLAIEAGGSFLLAKVDVDENPNLAVRYGVQGIPAVKAFQDGEVISEFTGARPEPLVRKFLDQILPGEEDEALEEARSMLATRHWAEAEAAFREALDVQSESAAGALGLVKALLMQGKGSDSVELLDHFPAGTEWAEAERLRPLAALLADVEEGTIASEDDPLAAELLQSARLITRGNLPASMDGLLDILRQNKRYRDGLPKAILLGLFALLGDEDPLTREYRDELASILF
ncbi:MAG: tetratricopeptide repeat protein [Anaerolineales bacterium]|nr:tetratricopeptide repeat protein [Anaerolineales bacterium]